MELAAKYLRLGCAVHVSAGFPFRGAVDALDAGDVAVIQMRNIEGEDVDWGTLSRVALPSKRKPDFLTEGDVIFTTRGRRNFALAMSQVPGLAVCSPHFFVMRVNDREVLLPAFLAWQINQKPAQEYLQQAATGSHILNITRAAIEGLPISAPSLEVQRDVLALAATAQRERDLINALIDNRQRQLDAVAAQILIPENLTA